MHETFVLTLGENETIDIEFDIFKTEIAQLWAEEVNKNYEIFEDFRLKGFPNSGKDLEYYRKILTEQVIVVNEYKPNTISVVEIKTQEDLNYLHKFFEDLRGEAIEGTEFFQTAPNHVQDAICKFNIYIHECEHIMRHYTAYPEITCTYRDRPRYDLRQQDYELFTFKWEFGTVYINYCEVGKPLLDVFKDQDDHVGHDNVRPLKYYSSDFTIKFGPDTPEAYYNARVRMFNEWYEKQNYQFDNLSLGLIPVAKIKPSSVSEQDIINRLSKFNKIKQTCIK